MRSILKQTFDSHNTLMLEGVIYLGRGGELTFIKSAHHVRSALYAVAYLILTTPLERWVMPNLQK